MRAGSRTPSNNRNAGPDCTSSASARRFAPCQHAVSTLRPSDFAFQPAAFLRSAALSISAGRPNVPPLARRAFYREQAPDAGRDRAHYGLHDPVAVFCVEDAERDYCKPSRREDEREKERILEDLPCQRPLRTRTRPPHRKPRTPAAATARRAVSSPCL
jgi:hypothetical protein